MEQQVYKQVRPILPMDIAISKISSKGQIVIPAEMRKGMHEGDKVILIREKNRIVLKKASQAEENFAEDLEFARRTEAAWKEFDQGKGRRVSLEQFEKELGSR